MNRLSWRVGVAAAAVLALSLTACSSSDKGGKATPNGANTSITVSTGTPVENWNPLSPTPQLDPVGGLIYQPLFWYNFAAPQDKPTPMLGTAYSWDAAGKVLTITTREGVKWSDGQPFSAKDVAFTFDLIQKTPAINASGIKIDKIEATDDKTVVLTFPKQSFTDEASIIANTPIVAEHVWSKIS